jgi:hypothetical protein
MSMGNSGTTKGVTTQVSEQRVVVASIVEGWMGTRRSQTGRNLLIDLAIATASDSVRRETSVPDAVCAEG